MPDDKFGSQVESWNVVLDGRIAAEQEQEQEQEYRAWDGGPTGRRRGMGGTSELLGPQPVRDLDDLLRQPRHVSTRHGPGHAITPLASTYHTGTPY